MTCSPSREHPTASSGAPATPSPASEPLLSVRPVHEHMPTPGRQPGPCRRLAFSQPDKAVWGLGQCSFQAKLERPRKSALDPRIHMSGQGELRSLTMVILIIPGKCWQ